MYLKKIIVSAVLMICLPSVSAWAATKKTPSTCANVGSVTVKCYQCKGGQKYLGDVTVTAAYEEDQGKKFCIKLYDARSACASKYGVLMRNVGFYAKYKLGWGTYEEFCKTPCVKAVGY